MSDQFFEDNELPLDDNEPFDDSLDENELPLDPGAAVPATRGQGRGPTAQVPPELVARYDQVVAEILDRTPEHMPEPSLHRVQRVMELMGDPQHAFPMVHLTGTNGKTSTARMVERLLRELGLRTGRFTSPHLHDMRERIALDGEPVSIESFLAAYDDVLPFIEMVDAESMAQDEPRRQVRMTYFEVVVALAYAAFADAPVDVAVVEVGLGGVWDATSVADGTVAVVTPISLDHTRLLGSTIQEIATEKAGIIKEGSIAIVGVQEGEAMEVLIARADGVGADLKAEGLSFGVLTREVAVGGQQLSVRGLASDYSDLFLPLFGAHQAHNAAMAVAAVEAFVGGGEQPLDRDVLRAGLAGVTSPGRLEIVRRSPTVLVDAGHNPAGIDALVEAIRESFTFTRLVGLLAVLREKDVEPMIRSLEPILDHVVVTRSTSPRAIPPRELGALVADYFGQDRVTVVDTLPEALDVASGLADEAGIGGAVLATGSVITAAEVRALLGLTTT
ncbi:MAG: folylpolyglutamate synthase/dihydrofolate synthase family protein [Ornithinimicrobium sp.]|uniref:bifunctional folylpolyglutamate synthase/dihydrofolate synthase n=1 Tax=Ornithinimicrobium sp. TaxID=1977084 RepID=UPI0026E06240|nr:folylpolyglutamate synthase/dihydrofolate synthase family protein [Ornithinimicrobium sp.]MDO5738965.1 folylpolyglutamate synthase/dihydrofolate synthase family protein [Ornithinimicrobium sp.]